MIILIILIFYAWYFVYFYKWVEGRHVLEGEKGKALVLLIVPFGLIILAGICWGFSTKPYGDNWLLSLPDRYMLLLMIAGGIAVGFSYIAVYYLGEIQCRTDLERGEASSGFSLQNYTRNSEAILQDYSKAIELDPKDAGAYYMRGVIAKFNLHDYTGAIQDFSKAIELNPKDANAYYMRGDAKEMLKDKRGALEDYSKAGELGDKRAYKEIQRIQKGD